MTDKFLIIMKWSWFPLQHESFVSTVKLSKITEHSAAQADIPGETKTWTSQNTIRRVTYFTTTFCSGVQNLVSGFLNYIPPLLYYD
jgi:hypothetical protein